MGRRAKKKTGIVRVLPLDADVASRLTAAMARHVWQSMEPDEVMAVLRPAVAISVYPEHLDKQPLTRRLLDALRDRGFKVTGSLPDTRVFHNYLDAWHSLPRDVIDELRTLAQKQAVGKAAMPVDFSW